jgi:hypothetical protein
MAVRLSALRTGRALLCRIILQILVLISVRSRVSPRAWKEGFCKLKGKYLEVHDAVHFGQIVRGVSNAVKPNQKQRGHATSRSTQATTHT